MRSKTPTCSGTPPSSAWMWRRSTGTGPAARWPTGSAAMSTAAGLRVRWRARQPGSSTASSTAAATTRPPCWPRWPHELCPAVYRGFARLVAGLRAPRLALRVSRGTSRASSVPKVSNVPYLLKGHCHEGNSLHIHESVTRPCVVSSGCGCSSDPSYLLAPRRRHGQGPRFPGSRRSVVTEGRSGPHRCDVGAVPRCCPAPGRACYAWFVPSACRPPPGSA
jgi:hypothetical protein